MKKIKYAQMLFFLLLIFQLTIRAQTAKEYLYISGTRFTYPLVEKWINEYKKINPAAKIKLFYGKQVNDSVNLKVVAHTLSRSELNSGEFYLPVGRYALLPFANERNQDIKKDYRKGLKEEDIKHLFFADTSVIDEEIPKKKSQFTIYSRANQGCSSIAFANHFGQNPSDIKGKKISGEDQYLTLAVQKDTTGISYNNLGYIFDLNSRTLLKGIKVVPLDINENGKIDKDEQQIFANLDQLTSYLENNHHYNLIPVDYVGFISAKNNGNNQTLNQFVAWILSEGQKYNHLYGFLNNDLPANLSQNLQSNNVSK